MDGTNNNSIEEVQLLIEEVLKCGGIKTAIKRLNQKPEEEKRKEKEEFVIKEKEDSPESIKVMSIEKYSSRVADKAWNQNKPDMYS